MGATASQVLVAGLFFLLVFLSGAWLSRSGRPLNTIRLTVHKLISLATAAFLIVTVHRINQSAGLSANEQAAVAITGLLLLGTVATGGLLSTGKTTPTVVLRLHQVTPFLTVLATAVMLYLLSSTG
jgi:hypothetical protein